MSHAVRRPSATPSMAESQQNHINDLVQRSRNLEQTNQKLQDQVKFEQTRAKETIADIQLKWTKSKEEWIDTLDVIQTCHRLSELRAVDEMEEQHTMLIKEQDVTRREKVLRLQRDYQLTMFQIRESELDAKIEELEEEKVLLVAKHARKIERIKQDVTEFVVQTEDLAAQLAVSEAEKDILADELSQLREHSAQKQVSTEAATSKLERITLQFEGSQTKIAELIRSNEQLKATNTEMQRQIDRWQSLEDKGVAEMETLRKTRIELEAKVQTLEAQLLKEEEEDTRNSGKDKEKLKKLKENVEEWRNHASEMEDEVKNLEKANAKLEKQLSKITSELEVERARVVKPASPHAASQTNEVKVLEKARAKLEKEVSKLKFDLETERAKFTSQNIFPQLDETDALEGEGTRTPPVSPTRARSPSVPLPKTRRAGPSRSVQKPRVINDSDIEELSNHQSEANTASPSVEVEHVPKASKRTQRKTKKGKEKAEVQETVEETDSGAPTVKRKKGPNSKNNTNGRAKRVRSGSNLEASAESGSQPVPEERKTKKRKINIFPPIEAPSLHFPSQGSGSLNIPTILSPVKDAPARSTFNIGSKLMSGFRRGG